MSGYMVAGNWKMNMTLSEGVTFAKQLARYLEEHAVAQTKIMVAVPFIHLTEVSKILAPLGVSVAAQNCAEQKSGAFTGEISATMIKSTGANAVLIGHSERRALFMESDNTINTKVKQALENNITPVLCVGEILDERKANRQENIVAEQLKGGLRNLDASDVQRVVIAYEPVWAIGTGETATPQQAQEMHQFIRSYIQEYYGASVASNIFILYGGSVKPDNAKEIFGQADVNGGLIGGASLKVDSFVALINTAEAL